MLPLVLLTLVSITSSIVPSVSMEQLQARVTHPENDTLYVVNFWATWCKPCVEEMPFFEKAEKKFSGQPVKVIFVSLDFSKEKDRVENFIDKKEIQSQVYLLSAGNPNNWIDKIDPSWSGAIPASVFYRSGKKVFFHEGDFDESELNQHIQTHLR